MGSAFGTRTAPIRQPARPSPLAPAHWPLPSTRQPAHEPAWNGRYLAPSRFWVHQLPVPVPAETPLEHPPEAAPEPLRVAERPVAWRPADEPTLGSSFGARWGAQPRWRKVALGALLLTGLAVLSAGLLQDTEPPLTDDAIRADASAARTAWAAARRQAPTPLDRQPDGSFFATGQLEPGDAETAAGYYVDFLVLTLEDTTDVSVIASSADFTPEVSVRTPEGARRGASILLGTDERAEVVGLAGPGRFEITLTSAAPGKTGVYEIATSARAVRDTLGTGDELRADTLGTGRPRAGRFEAAYALLAEPDQPVTLEVVSPDFAPRLTLLGPAGEIRQQRTLERGVAGDSLFGTVLRFRPGWDLPYTLLVSTERPGETGAFAMEMKTVDTKPIRTDGRAENGTLGLESWLLNGRYVDAYHFRIRPGDETEIKLQSPNFAPAFRLWREETRGAKEILAELNRAERAEIAVKRTDLKPGEYVLEVTSAEGAEDGDYKHGRYALSVTSEDPVRTFAPDDPDAPSGWAISLRASESGTSADGETFVVSVSGVSVSYPGGDRTVIQLGVTVRSVDYTGPWAPWRRFVSQSSLMDTQGRQYRPVPEQSAGTGVLAEPGSERRGRIVFTLPGVRTGLNRLVFSAPLGGGQSIPIRLDLPR